MKYKCPEQYFIQIKNIDARPLDINKKFKLPLSKGFGELNFFFQSVL